MLKIKKNKILREAIWNGWADYHGDFIFYHGIEYYVSIANWSVKKIEKQPYLGMKLSWSERRKINGNVDNYYGMEVSNNGRNKEHN